ncbi:MAG TPA: hypothetical protein VGE63_00185 [Candidatus Paceibacterota bacterium]
MSEPLFDRHFKILGMRIAVFPDRIIYKKSFFEGEKSVPIEKVASVEVGGYYSSNVWVTTTSGERLCYPVIRHNKEAFKDAIYAAKAKLKV